MNEELQAKIESLRDQYDEILDAVAMTDVTDTLGETASTIAEIPGQVQGLRDRGYVYANYLEHKAETLNRQWGEVRSEIQIAIRRELLNAQEEVGELDDLWDQLDDAISGGSAEPSASISPTKSGAGLKQMMKAAVEAEDDGGAAGAVAALGALGAAKGKKKSSNNDAANAFQAAMQKSKDAGSAGVSDEDIEALADQVESAMERASKFLESAKERIEGLYGTVPSNVSQTVSQIREIEGYLNIADESNFDFLAAEDLFMAVKAEWKKTGKKKDDPDGYFYITNQRVLMDQSEKKGGFLGFGGKKEEGLLWEAPVGALINVDYEKKGMLGGIDLIHLSFNADGPFADTTIEVKGGVHAKMFAAKLEQAISGEIEKERGVERDQAVVEAIADAPTTCSVCGATFGQEITRGMTQLECEYCGSIVRLSAS